MQSKIEFANMCLEPLKAVFSQLGRTWTVPIMVVLGNSKDKPRYHEISEKVLEFTGKEISDTTLSKRLSDLGELGLVERTVLGESPPQVQYALTETGRDAFQHVGRMVEWAKDACHTGQLKSRTCSGEHPSGMR